MTNEQRELVERTRDYWYAHYKARIKALEAALRLAKSARDYNGDMLNKSRLRCERLEALLRGLVSVHDSVTMGQERERRDEWLPKARAALKEGT
jgi:hypothetical protein